MTMWQPTQTPRLRASQAGLATAVIGFDYPTKREHNPGKRHM